MTPTVLVTAFTPARSSGTGLRTCGVIDALSAHGTVDVRYVSFGSRHVDPGLEANPRVKLRELVPGRGVGRLLTFAAALRRGVPRAWAKAASPELARAARQAPAGARVIVDGPTVAAATLGVAGRRPLTYLAHNIESGFREHVPGSPDFRALERFERRLLAAAEEVWLPTEADVTVARGMAPHTVCRHVPNVVDVTAITPVAGPAGTGRALFLADFRYAPNAEARTWLLDEVLPKVRARRPGFELVLAGRGSDEGTLPPEGVRALGFVGDVGDAYRSVDAVVVPLLHGGGSPLKFVEALAYGQAVVATSHAAGLLEAGTAGEHFLAAEDAAGFAAHLVDVLDGRAPRLGARARALAEQHCSVEALAELIGP